MLNFILPFLILILVVVFIHEYGHYYFAKKYGVGVTDFSIGFGQEIFGWNDKSGTRWKICWIPLGGYVKFFGDRNVFSQADQEKILEKYNEVDRKKLFVLKPLYQRVLIVFGGPLANFLLALVIFFSIYTFIGKDFTPAVINEVQKDSPAMVGGLKAEDIILEIDGNEVKSIMEVSKFITMSTGDFIDFKVKRSYDELILKVKEKLSKKYNLINIPKKTGGPARYYKIEGKNIDLGFITPLTHNFCESCNRVRLTCTGILYMCLGQDDNVDLKNILRNKGSSFLENSLFRAISKKPKGHDFDISKN